MIADTAAIVAILFNADDAQVYAEAITQADSCRMSAATFVETAIVVEAQTRNNGGRRLEALIRRASIGIEPGTEEQAYVTHQAFIDFGSGRHPASLNYGDSFSYALSKATREPLLFKGRDFATTDLIADR